MLVSYSVVLPPTSAPCGLSRRGSQSVKGSHKSEVTVIKDDANAKYRGSDSNSQVSLVPSSYTLSIQGQRNSKVALPRHYADQGSHRGLSELGGVGDNPNITTPSNSLSIRDARSLTSLRTKEKKSASLLYQFCTPLVPGQGLIWLPGTNLCDDST